MLVRLQELRREECVDRGLSVEKRTRPGRGGWQRCGWLARKTRRTVFFLPFDASCFPNRVSLQALGRRRPWVYLAPESPRTVPRVVVDLLIGEPLPPDPLGALCRIRCLHPLRARMGALRDLELFHPLRSKAKLQSL